MIFSCVTFNAFKEWKRRKSRLFFRTRLKKELRECVIYRVVQLKMDQYEDKDLMKYSTLTVKMNFDLYARTYSSCTPWYWRGRNFTR